MMRWLAIAVSVGVAGCAAPAEPAEVPAAAAAPVEEPPGPPHTRLPTDEEMRALIEEARQTHTPPPGLEARMLAAAESWLEVYSLDPSDGEYLEPTKPLDGPRFHRVKVLGSTRVQDAATRLAIVREVFKNFHPDKKDMLSFGMGPAYCFEPRHGVRVVDGAGTIDLVICYECGRMRVHSPDEWEGHILFFGYGRDLIRGVLQADGVPLPPEPHLEQTYRVTTARMKVLSVEGPRDEDVFRGVVRRGVLHARTKECFTREHEDRSARLSFTFVVEITKSGRTTMRLAEGLDPASELGRCVAAQLGRKFERAPGARAGAAATVELTFQR